MMRRREHHTASLRARMGVGVALNVVGAAFNQGSTFAVNLAVANLLGRERFGEYTMVVSTIAMVATVGQLSMGYTATKFLAEFRTVDPHRAARILSLCGLVAAMAATTVFLALAVPADWLAASVLKAPHLGWELRVAALAVFFSVVNGFLLGSLSGLEAYSAIARAGVVSGTVYVGICVALAWRYGLPGAVGGIALSATFQSAILAYLLVRETFRHGLSFSLRGIWQERHILTRFALPASLAGLITMPTTWAANAILARQTGGYEQLALFGAATNFRTMVLFLPHTINGVGMSLLNNQLRQSPDAFRRLFWMNTRLTVSAAVGVAACIAVASPLLLGLFGRGFVEGRPVLGVLLIPAVLEGGMLAFYQILVSRGRMWTSFLLVALPRDLTIVSVAAFAAPALGAVGLASAHTAGWIVASVGIVAMARRLGIRPALEAAPPAVR